MPVRISVVVPSYRRPERIDPLLEALDAQTLDSAEFEVLVVDNCSGDGTFELIKSRVGRVGYRLEPLQTQVNRGPSAARNLGWRRASGPIVAFIDDDCTPDEHWLENGLHAMESAPHLGVLQGSTQPPRPVTPREIEDHFVIRLIEGPTPYFEACNIFYRKEALEQTGGFDEDLGYWGEDIAAGWQVIEAGWDRGYEESALVIHPIEHRGFGWSIKTGLLDSNIAAVAARHPQFRAEAFWRPWAYRRHDAAFALALVGLAASLRWRPAAAAVIPYLCVRHPSVRRATFFRLCVQTPLVDAARLVGRMRGAAENRIFVL